MPANFLDELFYPGNTVQIEYRQNLLSKVVLLTSVESISEETIRLRLMQTDSETFSPIKTGTGLAVSAQEKNTTQVYFYTSEFIEHQPGNPSLLIIRRPSLIQTISRRNFFRCDVDFQFYYAVEDRKYRGQVENLSASGLYGVIKDSTQLKPGVILPLELNLPTLTEPLTVEAKIIRVQKVEGEDKWGLALHFNNPGEKFQNVIIKYLFQRQRELIKKGLIKIGTIQ
ncbi:MAG TPA: PilZ domain-containing protein [Bacillota bacterium]|nr:PilZ domain-containing protein [Bacillota bacterium]